jgi:hypothetical protein
VSENPAAVRLDSDAADVAVDERSQRSDGVDVGTVIGEEQSGAAIEPAAIDNQALVAIIQRGPLDLVLLEIQLGNALGDPVKQLQAIGVAVSHRWPTISRRSAEVLEAIISRTASSASWRCRRSRSRVS